MSILKTIRSIFLFTLIILLTTEYVASDPSVRGFAITISPQGYFPISTSGEDFSGGGGGAVSIQYDTGWAFPVTFGILGTYDLMATRAEERLSLMKTYIQPGVSIHLGGRLFINLTGGIGFWSAYLHENGSSDSYLSLTGNLNTRFLASPLLDLTAEVGYSYDCGLLQGLIARIGTTIHLSGKEERQDLILGSQRIRPELLEGARRPSPGKGIEFAEIHTEDVFPVFYSYYDDHPFGRMKITNCEGVQVTDVKVNLYVEQYMDAPKECCSIAWLDPSDEYIVDLKALFTEAILEITEGTKAAAEISIEFNRDGQLYRDARIHTLQFLDRNAMRWDDDRRAAAFVTSKDPIVMEFAKNTVSIVRGEGIDTFSRNLLIGMALHEALNLYGIAYSIDPRTPYTDLSSDSGQVDYLQFPRQSLNYRAGDCDDLSILYCALLEAVGIETAFITVPGHIYTAFLLETGPDETRRSMESADLLIESNGRMWLPVEITCRKNFLNAWRTGAKEWWAGGNDARLYPNHESWREYRPVGLPGGSGQVLFPDGESVKTSFLDSMSAFIDQELFPQEERHKRRIEQDPSNPSYKNRLGVLYSRYGRNSEAREIFESILETEPYIPALVNLGNLDFLDEDYEAARIRYTKALEMKSDNYGALLGLAMTEYEQGKREEARVTYLKLQAKYPLLAERYSYLGSSDISARASEFGFSALPYWLEE